MQKSLSQNKRSKMFAHLAPLTDLADAEGRNIVSKVERGGCVVSEFANDSGPVHGRSGVLRTQNIIVARQEHVVRRTRLLFEGVIVNISQRATNTPIRVTTNDLRGSAGRARTLEYAPGSDDSVDIFPSGSPTGIESVEQQDDMYVWLRSSFLLQVAHSVGLPASPSGATSFTPRFGVRDDQAKHTCAALLAEMEDGFVNNTAIGRQLLLDSLATALAVHILRRYSSVGDTARAQPLLSDPVGGLAPTALQRVFDYIQTFLGAEVGLTELSEIANLSPSHFRVLFKQSTGVTPHRFLMQKRVERAIELLQVTHQTIGAIALETGFADQSHLTRVMRERVGITPKDVRDRF